MDAVEYLKEKARMTNECNIPCDDCPVHAFCCNSESKNAEMMVSIVEKWASEHPVKTRQSEFLKMFPNADIDKDGVLIAIPCHIDKNMKKVYCQAFNGCVECRKAYWLEEVE